jgi:hypothetical protein
MPNNAVRAGGEAMPEINRRRFLLCTTMTGAAVVVAAPAAATETPNERAARLWCEFSAAMDEVAEGTNGWVIIGAGNRFAHPDVFGGGPFLNLCLVNYEREDDPRFAKPFYAERHQRIDLGKAVSK